MTVDQFLSGVALGAGFAVGSAALGAAGKFILWCWRGCP